MNSTEQIAGDVADVVAGRVPGRASPAELVVLSSTGLGVLEIAMERALYDEALAAKIGTLVPLA